MKKLKKVAAGILTLALSFSIVGTSVAPTFADDTGKNLEELQKAVTKAQEEYDAAENAYDNAPKKFLEDRMCDKHKSTLNFNQYIENIQNATGKNAEELHTAMENRKKEFTTADGKEDIQKKKSYAQKWISFDNLKLQSKWLEALNQRRATDKNKQSIEELEKSGCKMGRKRLYTAMVKVIAPIFLILLLLQTLGIMKL